MYLFPCAGSAQPSPQPKRPNTHNRNREKRVWREEREEEKEWRQDGEYQGTRVDATTSGLTSVSVCLVAVNPRTVLSFAKITSNAFIIPKRFRFALIIFIFIIVLGLDLPRFHFICLNFIIIVVKFHESP